MTTEHKPTNVPNPEGVKAAVQGEGGCGEVSPDGLRACIKDIGHEGLHGWESSPTSMLRELDRAEAAVLKAWLSTGRHELWLTLQTLVRLRDRVEHTS